MSDEMLVFTYKKSRFLIDQYIREIAQVRGRELVFLDSIPQYGMFDIPNDSVLYVVHIPEYDGVFQKNNHIIITEKTSYQDAVVFPELESWQIADYTRSICTGADERILDRIVAHNKDLYCLDNELHKLSIFDEKIRGTFSKQFLADGAYSNLESVDTFDFINAVQLNDRKKVAELYVGYEKDPMSFIGLMCNQFRNMVNVGLQKFPTEENTGLKSNQIYAIKKVCQNYSKEKIYSTFKFLISLDCELKTGNLPMENLFDYVLVKVLSI